MISDGDQVAIEGQKKYSWPGKWKRYDELGEKQQIETSEDFNISKKVVSVFSRVCKRHSIPIKGRIEISENGKLSALRKIVKSAGADTGTVKAVISDLKDEVFESIRPSDIRDEYFSAMQDAIDVLKNGAEDSSKQKLPSASDASE